MVSEMHDISMHGIKETIIRALKSEKLYWKMRLFMLLLTGTTSFGYKSNEDVLAQLKICLLPE